MAAPTTTQSGKALGTRPAGTAIAPALASYRVAAWGDSLTVGTQNGEYAWRQYLAEMALTSLGVTIVAVGATSSAAPSWGNHRALNGISIGTHVSDLGTSPTLLSNADPDVIMMCTLGTNDIVGDAQTGAQTLTRLTALAEIFRAYTNGRGVAPRLVFSYLFKGTTMTAGQKTEVDSFNSGLAAMVATQQGLGQLCAIADPRPWIDSPIGFARDDGLHPNDAGYRLLADAYFAAFCNVIGVDAQWGRPTS